MNIRGFFSICFISALSSCLYGQNDEGIIQEITDKVTNLHVSKDLSFDYLIGGQKILEKNLNDIKDDGKHQQITICCSNGVLCCGDGKMFELDNNGINNIDNFNQHGPVFTYINTNNHDSIKQIKYTGEIGNDNGNENAKLLNTLKDRLDSKKIDFEKKLLDKIISILENIFNGIDDRKGINISQYLKKKNDLRNLVLANINNQNEQNQIVLNLKNIYSFISELDKMFTSNNVFTGEVSELKYSNSTIITCNQANNEEYIGKVNNIDTLKEKILKKMDFCVADSIFEKINKENFFKIFDLKKIKNSLNVLKGNYKDLFHFEQPNVLPQDNINIINTNVNNILNNNEDLFFVNLKKFFGTICNEKQYKDIFEDTDHYDDINDILVNIKYKEDEQIGYSTFIKKIQKNLVGIYKKLLLIYFEKYLESQKNKIDYIFIDNLSIFLDEIKKKIEEENVEIDLFKNVSKIYAKNKKNLMDESDEDEEEDIVENKEIIKKFDLYYFKKYFEIRDEFREKITFDELNGFKKWFVLCNLQVILENYKSFLDKLNISQDNWEFCIPHILECKELLDQQPDFLRLLPIIGNLYEYYLKKNPKESYIQNYLEKIKFLQDFYPEILREINPNEIKIKDLNLNEKIEDLLSDHFGNLTAEKILDFVKEVNEKYKENKLLNVNKIFIEKKKEKFSREELENIFSWLDIKHSFLYKLPIANQDFHIKKEKINEIINCINLAIINSLLIKIERFVKNNENKNKVLNINKLKSVEKLKELLMNENEKKEEKNKDEEKILKLNIVINYLSNILDGFGFDEEKDNLNKLFGGENKENKKILEYKINTKEQGKLLGYIHDNLSNLSKTIDEKKRGILKRKEEKIIKVFTKCLNQCYNFISNKKEPEDINYLEKDYVSKFLGIHNLLKKWKEEGFIKGEDLFDFFKTLKNFKAFLSEKSQNKKKNNINKKENNEKLKEINEKDKKKKKVDKKENKEELVGINEKDILNFEKNKDFDYIEKRFYNIVTIIKDATSEKLNNIFTTLQKFNEENSHIYYRAIQKEDNCVYFECIEEYFADENVQDILSFLNRDDINIWVLNNFVKTINKCENEKSDDEVEIAQGFSIPCDIVKEFIEENNFKNFKNQKFLKKLSDWYNFFSKRLKQKNLKLMNNCLYLVQTDKGLKCLDDFLKSQLVKDNLPKYIKNKNFKENKEEFNKKIEILKKKKGGEYNDITELKDANIIGNRYNITNPLFRYFVAYCMKKGVAILPNPDLNNVIKKEEKENNNNNIIKNENEGNENKDENKNEIKEEKEEKEGKEEKEEKNEIKEEKEENEEKEKIDLYTYLTRDYSDNTRKDLEDNSLLENDEDKNPSFKKLEEELFKCNNEDKFLHDYLDEKIDLDENEKEEIIDLFSKYIIPFSSDVQEVFNAKLCQKVSGDVVEGDETVENLGTKGTAAEAFVYIDEKEKRDPLLIKIVRPEMQCKSEVKMLYETLINLKIKSAQRTNHKDCKIKDCGCENVIKVHNVFYCKDSISKYFNGALIVVMDYAEKGDMKNKIKKDSQDLPLSTISSYFKQLVNGLDFLHELKILHMDVKLANIVYGNDDKLKLIDFGYSIFYNDEKNLKQQIKYVPSNSFWVMSLEQFKIFFKQFEIEIKEKCNKKIEREIQEFITRYFFGDKMAFSHTYDKNEGFNIFDRINESKIKQLKDQFAKEANIMKIENMLKKENIEFRNEKLEQKSKEENLNEFFQIYDIYKAIINLENQKFDENTTKDEFINKNKKKVFSKKEKFKFFMNYFQKQGKEISKKVCEHYYDEQKIKILKENFEKEKNKGKFEKGYNVFQSDWCALLTYVLALSYRPFFDQVYIEDLEKDAKDKLEQIDRQKMDNILEKYCYLLFNSIFKVEIDTTWEDSNDVSKKYQFSKGKIFLHEDMGTYLHYSVRNVLEYIMNNCFLHDEEFNKNKGKEIVSHFKECDLYNYDKPKEGEKEKEKEKENELKKVKIASEEAKKCVEEFLSGEIETLLEKYKQCNNVKKLVVKKEITDITQEFISKDLIGINFLISCKDKQKQPKFFIFADKKEDNQKIDKEEKGDKIEIEIVNDKKIKVTKGDERALDLKKQKYAFFEIKTQKGEMVYLYCSDVESSGNGEDVYGIFENTNHKSISVIACDTKNVKNMAYMFNECKYLENLNISKIDTSNVTNMSFMFFGCNQIQNLNINNFDVKNVNNISSMFRNCRNLQTLNFKHFDKLGSETIFERVFDGCENLERIDIDNFSKLSYFAEKEEKENIRIDKEIIDKVKKQTKERKLKEKEKAEESKLKKEEKNKKIKEATNAYERIRKQNEENEQKEEKKRAKSYDKKKFNIDYFKILNGKETKGYVNPWWIGAEKRFLKIFTKIDKPKILEKDKNYLENNKDYIKTCKYEDNNTILECKQGNKIEGLNNKKYALFEITTDGGEKVYLYCSNIESADYFGIFANKNHKSISVIACDTSGVTNMKNMFWGCNYLEEINLDKFNTTQVTNMSSMFFDCRKLKNINFGKNFNTSNVTDMSCMFAKCSSLTKLKLSNFNTEEVTDMHEMFSECSKLEKLDLNNFDTNNVKGMSRMFNKCSSLEKINLDNFNTCSVENMNNMFSGCSSLRKLEFGENFNTEEVTDMHEMFSECSSLEEIKFGDKFDTSNVTKMSYMFNKCSSLEEINLDNFNTWSVKDMYGMFSGCTKLTKLEFGKNFNTTNVTEMDYMFNECSSLEEIKFGNKFNTEKVTSMYCMFNKCENLLELNLENFNTKNVKIMSFMFRGCKNLIRIEFGKYFNIPNVHSMDSMFSECSSLEELNLDNFNTINVENMDSMFSGCSSLREITFGKNFNTKDVRNMSSMFYECSSLKEIHLDKFNTENVTDMSWMFYECSSLKEINLDNFNTCSVENMSGMFSGCSSLKTLNLSKFKLDACKNIENMLYYCNSLEELSFPDPLYKKLHVEIEDKRNIFEGCFSLKRIHNTTSEKEILENIIKNKGKKKGKEENEKEEKSLENLLYEKIKICKIETKDILEGNKSGSNEIKKAVKLFPFLDFYLKYINKEDRLYKHIFEIADLYKDFFEEQNLSDYFLSKNQDRIRKINNFKILSKINLIEECLKKEIEEKLTKKSIEIKENKPEDENLLEKIKEYKEKIKEYKEKIKKDKEKIKKDKEKIKKDKEKIKDNNKLEKDEGIFINPVWKEKNKVFKKVPSNNWITLKISNDKKEEQEYSVKQINSIENEQEKIGLFKNVQNIETIEIFIPKNLIEEITDLSYMFYGCNQLKKVKWEIKDDKSKKISNVTNFSHMFYNCLSLYDVNLDVFDTKNVTDMSYMFYNCGDIANISESLYTQIYCNFEDNLYLTCFAQPVSSEDNRKVFENEDKIFGKWYQQYYKDGNNIYSSFEFNLSELKSIVKRLHKFYTYITNQNISKEKKETYEKKAKEYDSYYNRLEEDNVEINLFQLILDQIYGIKNEDPIIREWLQYIIDKKEKENENKENENKENEEKEEEEEDKKKYPNIKIYKNLTEEDFPYRLDLYYYKDTNKGLIDVKGSRYNKAILGRKNLNSEDNFDYIDLFFLSKRLKEDCNKIDFEKFNTSSVKNMAYMFYGCKYLYELDLKNWNLENVRNFEGMFAECKSLRNLTLGKNKDLIKNEIVENKNKIVENKNEIKEINEIKENKNEIKEEPTILRKYMFYNCKNLRDLDISNEIAKIDDPTESRNMFLGTTKLRTISYNYELVGKKIEENKEILGLLKEYKKALKELKKEKTYEWILKEEFKNDHGEKPLILDYKFYKRDQVKNFIKCTNMYTVEKLFSKYKNKFKFDAIEIHDLNSKKEKVKKFITENTKGKEGFVFDIIYKEKSGEYKNYIIYTNTIINNFFENNDCIIYVDCLYADEKNNMNRGGMFSNCQELLFVDISKIRKNLFYNDFYCCKKLKYVFLPKKMKEIDKYTFYHCRNLKFVTNIGDHDEYNIANNFNLSTNLLYFSTKKTDIKDKGKDKSENELKCKYFDGYNYFDENFYPKNNSSYIIIKEPNNFIKYLKSGYQGKVLISQKEKNALQDEEKKKIDEQKKQEEEEKKKEEEKNEENKDIKEEKKEDKKDEKKEEIKEDKKDEKTFWKEGIVNDRIVAFEEFKFKDDDFNIVKNEKKEEVETVDQIFYRFVQDEIKDMNDFLRKKMENWNKLKEESKTYEEFKNVFVFDYKRKNLFVPEVDVQENNEIIEEEIK